MASIAVACNPSGVDNPDPDKGKKDITIAAASQSIFSSGISLDYTGTLSSPKTISFQAAEAWSVSAIETKATVSWLHFNPSSGQAGSAVVEITVDVNTEARSRSATVTVSCGSASESFTVTVDGLTNKVPVEKIRVDGAPSLHEMLVGESVQKPLMYYRNNLDTALTVLEVMEQYDCKAFVFSSSATVYGAEAPVPYNEATPVSRITSSPYGNTKLMIEYILQDTARAIPGFNAVLLRYFNPVGAHESGDIGDAQTGVPVFGAAIKDEIGQIDGVERVSLYHSRSYVYSLYHLNNSLSDATVVGIDEDYLACMGMGVDVDRAARVLRVEVVVVGAADLGLELAVPGHHAHHHEGLPADLQGLADGILAAEGGGADGLVDDADSGAGLGQLSLAEAPAAGDLIAGDGEVIPADAAEGVAAQIRFEVIHLVAVIPPVDEGDALHMLDLGKLGPQLVAEGLHVRLGVIVEFIGPAVLIQLDVHCICAVAYQIVLDLVVRTLYR